MGREGEQEGREGEQEGREWGTRGERGETTGGEGEQEEKEGEQEWNKRGERGNRRTKGWSFYGFSRLQLSAQTLTNHSSSYTSRKLGVFRSTQRK